MIKALKILITGGAGFIGSHLANQLAKDHQLLVVDDLSSGRQKNLAQDISFQKMDISRPAHLCSVIKKFQPQLVFHLAAIIDVASTNIALLNQVNVRATQILMDCLKKTATKVIFASSVAVYGDNPNLPLTENSRLQPISSYGRSKLEAEKIIQASGLPFTIFRFSNVFGPKQSAKAEGGVVSVFFHRSLRQQPLYIFGDGRQTRDFIFVNDIVSGLMKATRLADNQIVNLSSQTQTSINHLAQTIISLTGSRSSIVHRPSRQGDIYHSLINNKKAITNLNWRPQINLSTGLQQYYESLST